MLNEVQQRARARGWLVIAMTAREGLVADLAGEELPKLLAEQDEDGSRTRLSGITLPAGMGGAQWNASDLHQASAGLRTQIELFTTIQHAFRDERELAFAGAGLPSAVSDLLSDDSLTFLRRAEPQDLGKVDRSEVARALREPIEESGRSIGDDALATAVDATAGYPYLIQLIGHRSYRQHPDVGEISIEDAERGAEEARLRMGQLVHGVALKECSDIDKTFLLAMAQDDGPSAISEIAERMKVDDKYAGVYLARLIDARLIEPAGRGRLDFALPFLREYLREHAAIVHVGDEPS